MERWSRVASAPSMVIPLVELLPVELRCLDGLGLPTSLPSRPLVIHGLGKDPLQKGVLICLLSKRGPAGPYGSSPWPLTRCRIAAHYRAQGRHLKQAYPHAGDDQTA